MKGFTKGTLTGVLAGVVISTGVVAVAGPPQPLPTRVQQKAEPVCTSGYNYYWSGVTAYNIHHGGTTPTPARPYNAGDAKPYYALDPVQQEHWSNVAYEAVRRACFPLVP